MAEKPDWWADISLYFSRYSNKKLKISLANIFPAWFIVIDYLFVTFLWMGHIFDFFHISGNLLWFIQILNIIEKAFIIAKLHTLIILIDISSCPCPLLVLSDFIILMSLSINWSEESLLSVIYKFESLIHYYYCLMGYSGKQKNYWNELPLS